ncbi:SigF/SigG family RNA polymerase sporulation sigma factor [Lysinibacillus odysseyi]|uniref:RNA polymerase sigma factor n=1 Tax=Lysinibacillus odysseyi 34hs-1 = NBRC 100172 TaxID=1220589 RepID=A0A0A3JCX4_9BACI|nr:SigF/SigG family RNA polymerase sporulation sigma factor [Lysinibacillus odysseyi]KGR84862.1 sporulation sigma factor SigF [Lysinibacillus odysseyi 34hs-1 = NBRC 100172]
METIEQPSETLLTQEEMRDLIARAQNGDDAARKRMIEGNTRLVWSIVQRFSSRGIELDDLFQIGCIGLMKSVDKFDLKYEVKFSTYAVPMIIGEIQRFLRDDGMVKVSRSIRELNFKIRHATENYMKTNEKPPSMVELAEMLEVSVDDIIMATDAMRDPASLHEQLYENEGDSVTLMDQMRDEKSQLPFDYIPLKEVLKRLGKREQSIIYLRYFVDLTQTEIAERLGISQVQVSRLEKKILAQLKVWMEATTKKTVHK